MQININKFVVKGSSIIVVKGCIFKIGMSCCCMEVRCDKIIILRIILFVIVICVIRNEEVRVEGGVVDKQLVGVSVVCIYIVL